MWDVGGQDQIRGLWRHYFLNTQAVIFVVDSNDAARLKEARDELWKVLESPELADAVLLIFANKQDLPNALNGEEITNGLDIKKIEKHPWHGLSFDSFLFRVLNQSKTPFFFSIFLCLLLLFSCFFFFFFFLFLFFSFAYILCPLVQPACATTGEGLDDGFDWLADRIREAAS